jgi:Arc/MetJ family transcription regulator
MRTNIEIDDKLMKETLKVTGLNTKKDVVDLALRELLRVRRQAEIKKLRGKFRWEGDLETMRLDK